MNIPQTIELPVSSSQHPECHPNGRKIRSDALPEHASFQDLGCELAPRSTRSRQSSASRAGASSAC